MRLALVVNDTSGSGEGTRVAALLRERGATVASREIADLGDGRSAPDAALADVEGAPAQRVVVAGGDGSVAPAALLARAAGVPLAVVPTGTANDFARALELPLDVEAAAELAARPSAATRTVELLRAGERPFVNAAAAGLSVPAARHARALKRPLGPLAYAVGALRAGATAPALEVRVVVDGAPLYAGRAWQVIAAGTGAFGGGSQMDAADPEDGLVDVAVLAAGSRLALARRAYAMRAGALTDERGVHHARGRSVELDLGGAATLNVDGELCRIAPACVESRDERVEVVVA